MRDHSPWPVSSETTQVGELDEFDLLSRMCQSQVSDAHRLTRKCRTGNPGSLSKIETKERELLTETGHGAIFLKT
jgi:hypothetical protein